MMYPRINLALMKSTLTLMGSTLALIGNNRAEVGVTSISLHQQHQQEREEVMRSKQLWCRKEFSTRVPCFPCSTDLGSILSTTEVPLSPIRSKP